MSKFAPFKAKFPLVAALIIILAGSGIAFATPVASQFLNAKATTLTAEADRVAATDKNRAIVSYKLASILQPGNHEILARLADLYVEVGQVDDAIAMLRKLPVENFGIKTARLQVAAGETDDALQTLERVLSQKTTPEALVLQSQVYLEVDEGKNAVKAAQDALSYSLDNAQAREQLALAYAAIGESDELNKLLAGVDAAAREKIIGFTGNQTLLARHLYALNLRSTAARVLEGKEPLAPEDYQLLAKITLARQVKKSSALLAEAASYLEKATRLDPANVESHKLLRDVYLEMGEEELADKQTALIKELGSK